MRRMRTAIGSRVNPIHARGTFALERNPAEPPGSTVHYSQEPGQLFADAKWRKTWFFPTNQKGLLLNGEADGSIFVQCNQTAQK
jgi:hypothetical protein